MPTPAISTPWVPMWPLAAASAGMNAQQVYMDHAREAITGGGTILWSSGRLFWNQRFITIARGNNPLTAVAGYFDIGMPSVGTQIVNFAGTVVDTVTAQGVSVPDWCALYYILPLGEANTSKPGNFRLISYPEASVIPNNWVLIAWKNGDASELWVTPGRRFNASGEIGVGGGAVVATTIAGFGTAIDGKQGLLRAGGGSHKLFTYDAAYGKWVSDHWSRKFDRYSFSHNTTVSTNYSDVLKFVEDHSSFVAAGCKLQYRLLFMMANWDNSQGVTWVNLLGMNEGDSWWSIGGNEVLNTTHIQLDNTPRYRTVADLQPNEWRVMPSTFDNVQVVGARWAIQSNASPDVTTTDVREMEVISRWVSA